MKSFVRIEFFRLQSSVLDGMTAMRFFGLRASGVSVNLQAASASSQPAMRVSDPFRDEMSLLVIRGRLGRSRFSSVARD